MMEPKKISFGFNKVPRKPAFNLNKQIIKSENVELIECLEGHAIKILNETNIKKDEPLVIPLIENRRTSASLASLKKRQQILQGIETEEQNANLVNTLIPNETEQDTLERKAVRELLQEAQGEQVVENDDSTLTLPIKPDELSMEGAAEPTLQDYESVPVSQFGLAMLRGMGWTDEMKKKFKSMDDIAVRPKGMGLGADKVLKYKPLLIAPDINEKLEIKKNAYVRILGGKHKDLYGQIEGLDDHAGRVIIKLALGGIAISLNEFFVQPVSKQEYVKYSKVINSAQYQQYKKLENDRGVKIENDFNFFDIEAKDHSKNENINQDVPENFQLVHSHEKKYKEHSTNKKDKFDDAQLIKKRDMKNQGNSNKLESTAYSSDSDMNLTPPLEEMKNKIDTSREYNRPHSKSNSGDIRRSRERNMTIRMQFSRHSSSDSDNECNSSWDNKRNKTSRNNEPSRSSHSRGYNHKKHKKKKSKKCKDKKDKYHDNSSDDKRHKKKTKKSKRQRSRSKAR